MERIELRQKMPTIPSQREPKTDEEITNIKARARTIKQNLLERTKKSVDYNTGSSHIPLKLPFRLR